MSHGGRAFQAHGYSAISPDALRAHRQSMINQQHQQYVQQQQQAVMTSVSTPSTTSAYSSNHHHAAAAAVAVAAAASGGGPSGNNPTTTATPSNHHTSPINSQHQQQQQQQQQQRTRPPPLDTMYCDSCQVFRHVTYFTDDRGIKYNVCILCRAPTQQLQKRKQIYEEQERAFKHARYSQYQQQQQQQQQQHHQPQPPPQQQPPSQHHHHQQQQQHQQQQLTSRFLHTPPTGGSPSSIQVKTSPPNFSASPLRTQSQLQSHVQTQVMQPSLPSLPMPQQPQQQQPQPQQHLHLPPYQATPQHHHHHHHQQTQQQQQPQPQPTQTPSNVDHRPSQSPIPPPSIPSGATPIAPVPTSVASSMAAVAAAAAVSQAPPQQPTPPTPSQQPPMMNGHGRPGTNASTAVNNTAATATTGANTGTNGRISPKQQQVKQEVLTLEGFVHVLQQETEFDRKHYDIDITPLIHRMGQGAGFSQLGRGVCEHVLSGTKFNFR